MIFLDANVFLRYLAEPRTPQDQATHLAATMLWGAVGRGEEDAVTSEAVVAEVAFILNARRHYNLPPPAVAAYLKPVISLPHLHLPRAQRERCLRALDLWAADPRLGFVDALTAVTVSGTDIALATFDGDFDGLPGITRWRPPATDASDGAR